MKSNVKLRLVKGTSEQGLKLLNPPTEKEIHAKRSLGAQLIDLYVEKIFSERERERKKMERKERGR